MTTRMLAKVTMTELRAAVSAAVGLPVIINVSNVVDDTAESGVLRFDMVVTESVSHNDHPARQCDGPGCDIVFFPKTEHARFHDDNCRLRRFRADKKAAATAPPPDPFEAQVHYTAGTPDLAADLIRSLEDATAFQPTVNTDTDVGTRLCSNCGLVPVMFSGDRCQRCEDNWTPEEVAADLARIATETEPLS